jgi:flagellar basal body rod protein FlgB
MKFIDSNLSQLMARAMDTYSLRHRITSANIVNIDTPGFKKQIEEEIEKYVNRELSKKEIDNLWSELIQHDHYMDYLKTVASLYSIREKEQQK